MIQTGSLSPPANDSKYFGDGTRAIFRACAGLKCAFAAMVSVAVVDYRKLNGWQEDDHQFVLWAFKNVLGNEARRLAQFVRAGGQSKKLKIIFRAFFWQAPILTDTPGWFTGYFEPEIDDPRQPTSRFRYLEYKTTPNLPKSSLGFTRGAIRTQGVLENPEFEIAWVDDPGELFFLEIHGLGRACLPDEGVIWLGYDGLNGRSYILTRAELVRRSIYQKHQVSARVIQDWIKRNPITDQKLLRHSSMFVFFRKISDFRAHDELLRAVNRSLTALRRLAVDPKYVSLDGLVWLEKQGEAQMIRLLIAQNTGSAIKGPQRGDVFLGAGDAAGRLAGELRINF